MKVDYKITGVFPKTSDEVLAEHTLIKEKVRKLGVNKPRVLISLDSGIAYVNDMEPKQKQLPPGNNVA